MAKSRQKTVATRARTATSATARRSDAVTHADALVNTYSGLGDQYRDRRVRAVFQRRGTLTQQTLDALWMEDGIASRVVEKTPDEMLRTGITIEHNAEPGTEQYVFDRLAELRTGEALYEALCYQRAYGGGAVVMGLDDGLVDYAQPMAPEAVKRVVWLEAVDRYRMRPASVLGAYDRDPRSVTYGRPVLYTVDARNSAARELSAAQTIHVSRALMFDGFAIPPHLRDERNGWGGSRLERAHDAIRNWRTVADSMVSMSTDLSTWVHKIPGFMELLRQNQRGVINSALADRDLRRGVTNAIVCDPANGGGVESVSRSLAGVGDLAINAMRDLAAAVDVPLAIMFGVQGAGLAQSHETDLILWENTINATREATLRRPMETLIGLILSEPEAPDLGDDWTLKFNPIRTPTAQEEATTNLAIAQRDAIYYQMGAPADWIIRARFGPSGFSASTPVSPEEMQAFMDAAAVDREPEDAGNAGGADDDNDEEQRE